MAVSLRQGFAALCQNPTFARDTNGPFHHGCNPTTNTSVLEIRSLMRSRDSLDRISCACTAASDDGLRSSKCTCYGPTSTRAIPPTCTPAAVQLYTNLKGSNLEDIITRVESSIVPASRWVCTCTSCLMQRSLGCNMIVFSIEYRKLALCDNATKSTVKPIQPDKLSGSRQACTDDQRPPGQTYHAAQDQAQS